MLRKFHWTTLVLILEGIVGGTLGCSGQPSTVACTANNVGGSGSSPCSSGGGRTANGGTTSGGYGVDADTAVQVDFQPSTVCPHGPLVNLNWQSATAGISSGTGGRALFHDVPAAGWLVVFEANGLFRAWRVDSSRGPGPTGKPLLLWVDDTSAVNLGQASDATFTLTYHRLKLVERFSKQLSCSNTDSVKNYLNVTLTWDVFGDENVVVARLKRDLIRGADGASLPAHIDTRNSERTKTEFETSAVDSVQAQLHGLADAGSLVNYDLQNTRSNTGTATTNCQLFAGSPFWSLDQIGQSVSLTGRQKTECIGVGDNPQLQAETTPNAVIYSEDSDLFASGWEGPTCSPCTEDHAGAWLAHSEDVPPTSTTYFVYSYTKIFDSTVNVGQMVHMLESQAGL